MNDWNEPKVRVDEQIHQLKLEENDLFGDPDYGMMESAQKGDSSNASNKGQRALAHASSFIALWVGGLMVLGPIIVLVALGDNDKQVSDHAREAINFHLSMMVHLFIAIVSMVVLAIIAWPLAFFVFFYFAAIAFASFVFPIIAAVKAYNGRFFHYPLIWRFLKR